MRLYALLQVKFENEIEVYCQIVQKKPNFIDIFCHFSQILANYS